VCAVLRRVLSYRRRAWHEHGIVTDDRMPTEAQMVEASPTHLEQILVSLVSHLERSLAPAADKKLTVRVLRLRNRIVVEMACSQGPRAEGEAAAEQPDGHEPFPLGLALCRSILRTQNGDLRTVRGPKGEWVLEVELAPARPDVAPPGEAPVGARSPVPALTVLLVEPEVGERRALLKLLGDAGHRAVPAASAEEAGMLALRLHFHAAFCSVHLPGAGWIEFFNRVRRAVDAFVLVTEGFDAELEREIRERSGLILCRPVEQKDLARLMASIHARLPSPAR
jgi:CheY-like chemotaxis protein